VTPSELDRTQRVAPRAGAGRLGWVGGALLLGAVLLFVTHRAEERELARLVREARPVWLLGAALLQAGTYVCAAAVWQRALAHHDASQPLRSLVPLGLAKLFTDQAVPSAGMSGTLLVVRALVRRATPMRVAVTVMLTGLLSYYGAYLLAMLAAVAILWRQGRIHPAILVPAILLCGVAVGVPIALLAVRKQPSARVRGWLERVPGAREVIDALREAPPGALLGARLVAETIALELAIFALDAGTLDFALRATSSKASFASVFASFVVASGVATLAWIPGGLGAFEASCVAMLSLEGVSVEAGLAATLLLRGLTFWLPMVPGLALARRELGRAGAA